MFKQRVKVTLLFLTFFILQYHLFPYFRFQGATPDLLAILVVFCAFYFKSSRLLLFAFLAGGMKDLFDSRFLGLEALSSLAGAGVLILAIRKIPVRSGIFRVLAVFCFVLVQGLAGLFLARVFEGGFEMSEMFHHRVFPVVLYTTCLSPVFLFLLWKTMKNSLRQYNLF